MSKIAQIRQIVKETRELVEEVDRDLKEAVEGYNLALEEFRVAKESAQLATIDELQESLHGIENLPETPYEPEIVEEEMERLVPIEPPAPFEVEEPKSGMFKAKFFGFVSFLVVLTGAAAVGALMRHIDLASISAQNWRQNLEEAFGFYSSLITQSPDSGAAIGTVAALALAFGVGYLIYLMMASGAASKNLAKAKELFEAAKRWSEEQRAFIERLKEARSFIEEANFALKGCRVFGDEFGARVKRARFFEGDDFTALNDIAKEEVTQASELLGKLLRLTKLELYATDYQIAQSVRSVVEDAKAFVLTLKEKVYG